MILNFPSDGGLVNNFQISLFLLLNKGAFRKRQFFLTLFNENILPRGVGGSKKPQNTLLQYINAP